MTTFGYQIPGFRHAGAPDVEMFDRTLANALAAEDGGFSSVWVMDHFWQLPALGGPDEPILEAYTLLGALAARTERVQLGTLVTGVTYRNPAMLAKMVTTLDVVSHGRAILGIGAAWYDVEHVGYGFAFPTARERLDRLEEAVQICRAMFRDERPAFKGRYYETDDARNVPKPVQTGGPPIMIGGGGEKRTLRLVAQYADMCNVSGGPETVRHKLDVMRAHCADVGRDPSEIMTGRSSSPRTPTKRDACAGSSRDLRGTSSRSNSRSARPTRCCTRSRHSSRQVSTARSSTCPCPIRRP